MSNPVLFELKFDGNGEAHLKKISSGLDSVNTRMSKFYSFVKKAAVASLSIVAVKRMIGGVKKNFSELEQAYQAQNVAETKLRQVMRNTIGATDEQIKSVKELAAEQQKLGVISSGVQISGAQELATYVSKTESIKKLLPAMNDMLAQQYGINASQEQATNIASMMGKVLDGQVGALSRYGYKFSKAEERILKFGKEEQRVAVLSKIIAESVGGVNKALADTPEGKMAKVANEMGDAKGRIGKFITITKNALYPVYETILGKINKVGDWFERNQERISGVVTKIARGISVAINGIWSSISMIKNFIVFSFNTIAQAIQKTGEFFVWLWEKIKNLYPIIISVTTVIGAWIIKSNLLRAAKYKLWWQVNLLKRDIGILKSIIVKNTAAIWAKITSVWSAVAAMGVYGTLTWLLVGAMGALKIAIRAVSAAIYAIPIIGWIAAGISLVVGIFKLLWDKSEGFRRVLFGVWEVIKTFFAGIGGLVSLIWQPIKGLFSWIGTQLSSLWDWVKSIGQNIGGFFSGIFSSVGGFFTGIWDYISGFFSWLWSAFANVGKRIKDAFQPLLDIFDKIFAAVKKLFSWVSDKIGTITKPIGKLWNRIRGKTKDAYEEGAEKGSKSWRRSQAKKKGDGILDPAIPGVSDLKGSGDKVPSSVTKGAEATATGGTRNTQININMGKFFDNMVFNGGLTENAKDIERKMEEILLRVLYSAQNAG